MPNDNAIYLYCPAGWKCEGFNRVQAKLNGYCISMAVAQTFNAIVDNEMPINMEDYHWMLIPAGESATFEDFAEALESIFNLPIYCKDKQDG